MRAGCYGLGAFENCWVGGWEVPSDMCSIVVAGPVTAV